MPENCRELPRGFSVNNCDNEFLTDLAIENIARGMCRLGCRGENIRCSGSPFPYDWENLFTNNGYCDEAPCGSMILKSDDDGVLQDVFIKTELKDTPDDFAGTWASMFDPVGFDGEFRVASGLPDPANPTSAQLKALFGETPWNYALVYIPETGVFWYTRSKGRNFTQVKNSIDAEVHSFTSKITRQVGISPLTTRISVKPFKTFPAGTRIRCTFNFGYRILEFGNGENPLDTVEFRTVLRADVGTVRQAHRWANLRNGFDGTAVLAYTLPYDSTMRLDIRSAHTGSYVGWKWEVFLRFAYFQALRA